MLSEITQLRKTNIAYSLSYSLSFMSLKIWQEYKTVTVWEWAQARGRRAKWEGGVLKMVEVSYTRVRKYNNEICWICFKKRGEGMKRCRGWVWSEYIVCICTNIIRNPFVPQIYANKKLKGKKCVTGNNHSTKVKPKWTKFEYMVI
jgi:hypothetical protein